MRVALPGPRMGSVRPGVAILRARRRDDGPADDPACPAAADAEGRQLTANSLSLKVGPQPPRVAAAASAVDRRGTRGATRPAAAICGFRRPRPSPPRSGPAPGNRRHAGGHDHRPGLGPVLAHSRPHGRIGPPTNSRPIAKSWKWSFRPEPPPVRPWCWSMGNASKAGRWPTIGWWCPWPAQRDQHRCVIELQYHFPDARPPRGAVRIEFPRLGPDVWVRRMYWQLVLPANEHVTANPAGFTGEFTWDWEGYFWGRQPLLGSGAIGVLGGRHAAARLARSRQPLPVQHAGRRPAGRNPHCQPDLDRALGFGRGAGGRPGADLSCPPAVTRPCCWWRAWGCWPPG